MCELPLSPQVLFSPPPDALLEKCEQATQGSECITSASFDVDIENFVHQQGAGTQTFFSDDQELDNSSKDPPTPTLARVVPPLIPSNAPKATLIYSFSKERCFPTVGRPWCSSS